jgi:trehalose-6-phosphate synthase
MNFDESLWSAYQEANEAFAAALAGIIEDGDLLWIQDYHLFLLPQLVRRFLQARQPSPSVRIGFFLHTPFPSSEIYRVLPVSREVLAGVLQSDLIGFHTDDYSRHFLSSCSRLLGVDTCGNRITVPPTGHTATVGVFPIGIDPDQFAAGLAKPEIRSRALEIRVRFAGMKILVGVDRLDYIKGVPQKLHALELFLSKHPEFHEKVGAILWDIAYLTVAFLALLRS